MRETRRAVGSTGDRRLVSRLKCSSDSTQEVSRTRILGKVLSLSLSCIQIQVEVRQEFCDKDKADLKLPCPADPRDETGVL